MYGPCQEGTGILDVAYPPTTAPDGVAELTINVEKIVLSMATPTTG